MFWIPPIASTVMLLLAWQSGLLRVPRAITVAWAVALVFQGLAGVFSPVWVIGLVIQVFVALYLAVKLAL